VFPGDVRPRALQGWKNSITGQLKRQAKTGTLPQYGSAALARPSKEPSFNFIVPMQVPAALRADA
jgi:hypothetical protein